MNGWNFEGMYRKLNYAETKAHITELATYTTVGGESVKPVKVSKYGKCWWVLYDREGKLNLSCYLVSQVGGEFGYKEVTNYVGAPIRMLQAVEASNNEFEHLCDFEREELATALKINAKWAKIRKAGKVDCVIDSKPYTAKRGGNLWGIYDGAGAFLGGVPARMMESAVIYTGLKDGPLVLNIEWR